MAIVGIGLGRLVGSIKRFLGLGVAGGAGGAVGGAGGFTAIPNPAMIPFMGAMSAVGGFAFGWSYIIGQRIAYHIDFPRIRDALESGGNVNDIVEKRILDMQGMLFRSMDPLFKDAGEIMDKVIPGEEVPVVSPPIGGTPNVPEPVAPPEVIGPPEGAYPETGLMREIDRLWKEFKALWDEYTELENYWKKYGQPKGISDRDFRGLCAGGAEKYCRLEALPGEIKAHSLKLLQVQTAYHEDTGEWYKSPFSF